MPEMPCTYQEGSSAVEVHDLCVCSTLYNTQPNLPSTTGEYHNERHQSEKLGSALAFHELFTRP